MGGGAISFNAKVTLFLDHFCVLNREDSVLIVQNTRHRKCIKHVVGHNVEQPSSILDVNRTLR